MAERIVYQVEDLHKFYEQREVLKGITMAFHETSKIGLIGANGAGKSTFLRILAGVDKDFEGIARTNGDVSIGYLSQEPQLDPGKDVKGNIDVAVNHLRETEARYYEVMALMGDTEGPELAKLSTEFDRLQHEMDVKDIWNLEQHLDQAMHALQVPPHDRDVREPLRGRKASRRTLQATVGAPGHAPSRRADEPLGRGLDPVARDLSQGVSGARGAHHPRSLLPRQRRGLHGRGRRRPRNGSPGNYSDYLEFERTRLDVKRKHDALRDKRLEKELQWIRGPRRRRRSSPTRGFAGTRRWPTR